MEGGCMRVESTVTTSSLLAGEQPHKVNNTETAVISHKVRIFTPRFVAQLLYHDRFCTNNTAAPGCFHF
jgi:hypothetical protein